MNVVAQSSHGPLVQVSGAWGLVFEDPPLSFLQSVGAPYLEEASATARSILARVGLPAGELCFGTLHTVGPHPWSGCGWLLPEASLSTFFLETKVENARQLAEAASPRLTGRECYRATVLPGPPTRGEELFEVFLDLMGMESPLSLERLAADVPVVAELVRAFEAQDEGRVADALAALATELGGHAAQVVERMLHYADA